MTQKKSPSIFVHQPLKFAKSMLAFSTKNNFFVFLVCPFCKILGYNEFLLKVINIWRQKFEIWKMPTGFPPVFNCKHRRGVCASVSLCCIILQVFVLKTTTNQLRFTNTSPCPCFKSSCGDRHVDPYYLQQPS